MTPRPFLRFVTFLAIIQLPILNSDRQVDSPNKLEEKEKSEVSGEVTKALNEHFEAFNRLSKQHFAEGSDEESDSEDVEMEIESPSKSEKPDADSIAAEDTSNLQLAWEMLELAKVFFGMFRSDPYLFLDDLREESEGCIG